MAQIFALMPVSGIRSRSVADLRFSWLDFRTIYSVLVLCCQIGYTFIVYWFTFNQSSIQFKSSGMYFYGA